MVEVGSDAPLCADSGLEHLSGDCCLKYLSLGKES